MLCNAGKVLTLQGALLTRGVIIHNEGILKKIANQEKNTKLF